MSDYNYRSRKTVVLLSSKIQPAVALNVVGHLCIAIGAYSSDGLMGQRRITDASDVEHSGISRYPVIVLKTRPVKLRKALNAARETNTLFVADYPSAMLDTAHDNELVAAIEATAEPDFEYFGLAATGPAEDMDRIFGEHSLWRID